MSKMVGSLDNSANMVYEFGVSNKSFSYATLHCHQPWIVIRNTLIDCYYKVKQWIAHSKQFFLSLEPK